MLSRDFIESDEDILNPERGYYVGYDLRNAGSASFVRNGGKTLAITLVRLDAYRSAALDSALLDSLANGFDVARNAGIKVILRFTYNSSFTADASKTRILQHITQLAPLLQANADIIAVMQAGFIGAWGEWHGSTNGLSDDGSAADADRSTILTAILNALPEHRGVQVRKPNFKEAAFGAPLDETEAYGGTMRARVGHHNDCFLASETDLGTFDGPEWVDYVAADSRFTAIGGETCKVYTPRTTCGVALDEMETQHWSYLNAQYKAEVLAAWDAAGCGDEIRRRLGYRFAVDRVTYNEAVAPGGELQLEIDLHNSGFAAPYNYRPVDVVLTSGDTRLVARLEVDARTWQPGVTVTLAVRLRIPSGVTPGSYTLALRLPDAEDTLAEDPRYAIRFANEGVWDATSGDNVLVDTLVIDEAAPGSRDVEASEFAQL